MKLSPREVEGLLIHQCGYLAQKRLARGVRLNHPEAIALIVSQVLELVRDGYTVSQLMSKGREMLGTRQVLPGVPEMITEVQVEGTFPDGTKLVTVHSPICRQDGDLELALYGSFLPLPDLAIFAKRDADQKKNLFEVDSPLDVIPGEITPGINEIVINQGRRTVNIKVTSRCDRPVQIGSHYHFLETNKYLTFDRAVTYGMRLNIPSGTAVRFEPGETKTVNLVEIGGNKIVRGGNGLSDGKMDPVKLEAIMARVKERGFGNEKQTRVFTVADVAIRVGSTTTDITLSIVVTVTWAAADSKRDRVPYQEANVVRSLKFVESAVRKITIPRMTYAHTYGPTVGDKIRLGDTSLVLEVVKDMTIYGEELKFGGGKVIREGMGQQANRCNKDLDVLDTVITNALILDAVTGVLKADVGIKDGRISSIGKAGNPDVMDGVTPGMVVAAGTEVIAGEGLILTAGGIDGHVHFICPQLAREAIASGLTTLFGGGTGPATGTNATTCSPGPNHIRDMLQSTDAFSLNFGFTGKGNSSILVGIASDLEEQILAGAMGLKLHEDWGTTPSAIDTALRVADEYDIQITIHTDTLNESACVEQTIEAFKGRAIHTYHSEGAGGGHAPDIIRVVSEKNVIPSSTNPTRPYTANTIDEHLDMLMVCHHLDKNLKEDVAFAESRIRAETIAAEDILHDLGAISIMSSDSQAMGRIGEVICRTWQTADKMKLFRGRLKEETGENDNERILRYVAKYTINPALAHGMAHVIGSVEVGKLADLVLWSPGFFGAKPEMIIKGGQIAWSQMGMPNASIPTPEPVKQRKMFGAYGKSVGAHSIAFVSQASLDKGLVQRYGLSKQVMAVKKCRTVNKTSMIRNNLLPKLTVDPYSYKVHMVTNKDGKEERELLTCPPASRISLAQRYFLF